MVREWKISAMLQELSSLRRQIDFAFAFFRLTKHVVDPFRSSLNESIADQIVAGEHLFRFGPDGSLIRNQDSIFDFGDIVLVGNPLVAASTCHFHLLVSLRSIPLKKGFLDEVIGCLHLRVHTNLARS